MELLRDKPEFKEVIENNLHFAQQIEEATDDLEVDVALSEDFDDTTIKDGIVTILEAAEFEFTIEDNKITGKLLYADTLAEEITNKVIKELFADGDNIEYAISNKKQVAESVVKAIGTFVNDNYISIKEDWKSCCDIL